MIAALAMSACFLWGQKTIPSDVSALPAAKQPAILHVTTRLVQVNVIAHDNHGNPVTNLKQSDFSIFDNGEPQSVELFKLETSAAPGTMTPLPPDTFSNLPVRAAGGMTSGTAILLDSLNTPISDQQNARNQVIRFVQQLRPDDRVALYTLGAQLRVLQDFTGDARALLAALDRYKGYISPQLAASTPAPVGAANPMGSIGADLSINLPAAATAHGAQGPRSVGAGDVFSTNALADYQRSLEDSRERQADLYVSDRVYRTADALRAIAEHLTAFSGRKSLVWVSGGFPYWVGMETTLQEGRLQPDQISFDPEIRSAARALNDADIAVYPVDARGMMVSGRYDAGQAGTPSAQNAVYADAKSFADIHSSMDRLAAMTGGRAFYNTNNITGAVRSAIDDSRVAYVLGYYPQKVDWDGELRTIKIDVDRAGVNLHYRRRYAALPDEGSRPQELRATLLAALHSPLAATGVGLTAHAHWDTNPKEPAHSLDLQILVDPSDISFRPENEHWHGSVTIATAALDSSGNILKVDSRTFTMDLTAGTREKILAAGLTLQARVEAPQSTEHLGILVRDDLTGIFGSMTIPLDRVVAEGPASNATR